MANPNLKAAAAQANLSPAEQSQVDGLSKLLDSHRSLLNMPQQQAEQTFATLPKDQQNAHVAMFGGQDPATPTQRGWLGSAAHYIGSGVKTTIAAPFKALGEVSDFMTRLYRTGAIALDQNVDLSKAFELANDKGDKVFSPTRIEDAKAKFGDNYISVAMKVASGQRLSDIIASGTPEEQQIAGLAAQKKDPLFQDALDAVQAAKYSPGRQVANLLLPGSLEGSGFLYKGISGIVDAGYRIFADPTLALGKAKKSYDAGNWLFYRIIGKEDYSYGRSIIGTVNNEARVDRVFSKPGVTNFFNVYGEKLSDLKKYRETEQTKKAVQTSTELRRLAPEFGPAAIDEFIKAGVTDATTASNYLKNIQDTSFILRGQGARKTALIPTLGPARQARVTFLTTANKVFNIDKVGQQLVRSFYGTDIQPEDVLNVLKTKAEELGKAEKQVGKLKQDGSFRLNINQIQGKIDRFSKMFATIPYFKDGYFDVNSPDAVQKVYQLARLGNTRYHSKILSEAFAAGDEGQKRQIFNGIWQTLAEIRGWNKSSEGLKQMEIQVGERIKQYAPTTTREIKDSTGNVIKEYYNPAEFNGQQMAVFDWQLSSGIAVPSIFDLDTFAAKGVLLNRKFGPVIRKWADKVTSAWVFGTLAGPRFVIRNASEDLAAHVAIGDSPWGIVKSRFLNTRLNLAAKDGNLGFMNKFFKRNEIAKYEAEVKAAVAAGDVNAVRTIQAKAVMEDGIGAKLDKEAADILAEHIKYGDLDTLGESVSEGSKNALRGASRYLNVTDDVSKYGKVGAITVDGVKYRQATGSSFSNFNPVATQQARVSWLTTIAVNATSDLGSLAIKYLSPTISRETAINGIRAYLDELPPKALSRFELYKVPGTTTQRHAEAIYDSIRPYFTKRDGSLNEKLLSKVRVVDKKGNVKITKDNLHLEDIPGLNQYDLAPEFISGPSLVPLLDTDNFAAGIMDKGWDIMGAANARLTRLPLANYAVIEIGKTMKASGFEANYIAKATAGKTGDELVKAEEIARKQLTAIREDLAKERVLSFVDNPEVRTQLAMSVRNFARFYRATEDFYRRVYRTVRYNPEALTRASLTYEGVAHSGFVQKDDNGDEYFFYPALAPVYKVMANVARVFGFKDAFKVPAPVEFGAKIKMLTPSLNPDSLFPTFAGPLAAVPLNFIGNIIPQVKDLEGYLMGSYGQDQPLISAVLPAHVNRALAALNRDERNSQYASAARKAATYLEATGHGVQIKIDPVTKEEIPPTAGELIDYQNKLQSSTLTVLLTRFLFGFIAPASPQITLKSDMSKWVRDNNATNFKQVYNQLLKNNNYDYDKTTEQWIKNYPDQMPYTISESTRNTVASVAAVESAANWIDQNQKLLNKYPQGAAFLIPNTGDFDFNAYKLLSKSGMRSNKTLTDFVTEVQAAKDKQIYYSKKNEYEDQLKTAYSDSTRRFIKSQWDEWSTQFKGARPALQEELSKGAAKKIEKLQAYRDLRLMLDDPEFKSVQPKTRAVLQQMVDEYENYVSARDLAMSSSSSSNYKDILKSNAIDRLKEIASQNPSALSAYQVLFSTLIGE